MQEVTGLTTKEVKQKQKLGLGNKELTSFTPSNLSIILRNVFTVMHVILIPLILVMFYFDLPRDAIVFIVFIVINAIINSFEEVRIKARLEKLKDQFIQKVTVIRDGNIIEIPVSQIVQGEYIKAKEGDPIVVDGKIISSSYLQLDESALTGESNYINKNEDDEVLSGSFIVAGECIYLAEKIGNQNYLNKLGSESLSLKKQKSRLESYGDAFTLFFIISGIAASVMNYYFSGLGNSEIQPRILSITTLVAMIIPQTLLLLYSLTFVISISRLGKKGIIIQKRGAIDDLAGVDVMCIDKTGTITTNEMKLIKTKFFNTEEKDFGSFFTSIKDKVYGKNNTYESLEKYFSKFDKEEVLDFDQVPFNPKNKFSVLEGKIKNEFYAVVLGAPSVLKEHVDIKMQEEITKLVNENEDKGFRVLLALITNKELIENNTLKPLNGFTKFAVFVIEEQLNPGISDVLKQVEEQEIEIKIISGDSAVAVSRIIQRIGLTNKNIADLSKVEGDRTEFIAEKIKEGAAIFARAKPEDKLTIIRTLKEYGHRVAMVGDGINDVLGMKVAHVGIAMESGAKITRDISDIVLLNNDYSKIPEVFYEGDNIVFNLKLTTKIFLARAFAAFVMASYFSYLKSPVPILPTSTLIFSFMGNTVPSYVLAFTRQKVANQLTFVRDIITSSIPIGLFMGFLIILLYAIRRDDLDKTGTNTYMVLGVLSIAIIYSLLLIYEAKKMRNILVLFAVYSLSFLFGFFETILPPWNFKSIEMKIFTGFCVVLFGFIVHMALRFQNRKLKDKQLRNASYYLPVILIILAYIVPFQDYYAIGPLNLINFIQIGIVTVIAIVGFGLIEFLRNQIVNQKSNLKD